MWDNAIMLNIAPLFMAQAEGLYIKVSILENKTASDKVTVTIFLRMHLPKAAYPEAYLSFL